MNPDERALSSLSQATRPLKPIGIVMACLGLAAIAAGVIRYVTAPAELPMSADGWFESVRAHSSATSTAFGLGVVGLFLVVIGGQLAIVASRRVQRMGAGLVAATAAAVKTGLGADARRDPSTRLAELDELQRKGLISATEHASKRAEIVSQI